jgi:hypothetical protein
MSQVWTGGNINSVDLKRAQNLELIKVSCFKTERGKSPL